RGWSPPGLGAALERLAGRSLTGGEKMALRHWADAAHRMTVHHAAVLETTDPAIITRLASTRRGRALIHRTLSPRAVVVDPAQLDHLVRRLTEQEGIPPKVEYKIRNDDPIHNSSFIIHNSEAAHLWQLVRVYQDLGRHIPLPVRLPQSLLDKLAGLASPQALAAADIAAEQTTAVLQDAIDGRSPFPPWTNDGLPLDHSLPIIQAALAGGHH
ncbi:MAG: hypothetical protein KDJ52_35950, partial [Anaerolineae bacterium]|nr:hypothetical protein [Anaerolineae bacterium]